MELKAIQNKKGFKETKLGWIPEDWELKTFSFLAYVIMGQSPKGSSYNQNNIGIPLINGPTEFTKRFPIKKQWTISPTKICKKDDILICVRGSSTGRINISNDEYCIGRGVAAIRAKEKFNQDYVEAQLLFAVDRILKMTSGSTFPNISSTDLRNIGTLVPPLLEQKAIANCLSTWDTTITRLDNLIKAKQQLKKALMQQLLSGKKRLTGFSGEWETNRFDYFLNYTPRPINKPETAFTKLGIRSHCKGTFQNINFEPANIAIDTLYLVQPNDLIVNITFAWEGAVAIVKQKDEGALVSHRFPTYEFIDGISDVQYFRQFIQTKKFRFLLELISPGGAGRNRVLSKKELNALKITIPNYQEQTAIAQVLNTADQEIKLLTKQHKQLQLQKKGLMQQLLTGKKRLKV